MEKLTPLQALDNLETLHTGGPIDFSKHFKVIRDEINKASQYDSLEKELGIDLITLFKALINGIYAYDHANDIDHMKIISTFYDTKDMECLTDFDGDIFEYNFEDYGKTWALTREELL